MQLVRVGKQLEVLGKNAAMKLMLEKADEILRLLPESNSALCPDQREMEVNLLFAGMQGCGPSEH